MGLAGKSLAETGYLHNLKISPLKINTINYEGKNNYSEETCQIPP